jgi:hypothetical protein
MVSVPRFGNLRTRLPLGLDRCRNLAPPVHAQGLLAVRGAGVDVFRLRERGVEGGLLRLPKFAAQVSNPCFQPI